MNNIITLSNREVCPFCAIFPIMTHIEIFDEKQGAGFKISSNQENQIFDNYLVNIFVGVFIHSIVNFAE